MKYKIYAFTLNLFKERNDNRLYPVSITNKCNINIINF